MNIEELREYCMSFKGANESFPFDDVILVFKIQGKMFAVIPLDEIEATISLKCDPEKAIDLRERYEAINAAYHFNKKHWNSVLTESGLPDQLIKDLIKHSYELVVSGLSKKLRESIDLD